MSTEAGGNPSSSSAVPAPGTVLSGKYKVEGVLGEGGMGVVLQARNLRTDQTVALKLLRPEVRAQPETTARFEREARAAAKITGPHVARVFDVDNLPDGSPMMVMELLQGWDLGQELAIRGPLPPAEAVGYILQACEALAQAHRRGIVHRDLKPGNLFLCQEGNRRILKVLDFGISKFLDNEPSKMTATSAAFGTPQYMSPEQVRSAKNVDARSDIWSLGVVLYELLGGRSPFEQPTATGVLAAIIADPPIPLQKIRPDAPPQLAAAVMRALEKSADARYPDIDTFVAAIAPFAPGSAAAQTFAALPSAPARPSSRSLVLAIGAALLLGVTAAVVLLLRAPPAPPPPVPASEPPAAPLPAPTVAAAPTEPTPTVVPVAPLAPLAPTTPATARPAPTGAGAPAPQATAEPKPPPTAAPAPTPTPKPTGPAKPPPPPEDPTHL